MTKLDPTITLAPKALTLREVMEVTADGMTMLGLTHRAITRAGVWNKEDGALYRHAESAIEACFAEAKDDLDQWLADCKTDGDPRFYNNEVLGTQLRDLASRYEHLFNRTEDRDLEQLIDDLRDRDFAQLLEVDILT
jgi:hypothetical protein